ncbi:MAG TPA: AI-2E family transporter [Prosthecobacter sp.]|nr:AI-2E family transporter [Prosthecobacter sp.]
MPEPQSAPATSDSGSELPPASTDGSIVFAAKLLTFCLLAALLYWGRVVAIPLALAILLSFTLKPVVRLLQRCHLPRVIAVVTAVTMAMAILAGVGWLIGSQLASLSNELPKYRENIAAKVRSVRAMMRGGAVEKIQGTMETLAAEINKEKASSTTAGTSAADPHLQSFLSPEAVQPVPVYLTSPQRLIDLEAIANLLPIVDPLTTAALVLILVILILLRWGDLRSRIISFSGHQNLSTATRACDDAGHRISRYLIIQLVLNGSYGLTFAIGLFFIGVPYAALWGLCAGLFRYLPYVGPVLGGALPVVFTLITSEGWSQPLWVGGLILGMELISNNVLEPWLYGSRLGLSEVGLILAAVAWTFLWGPVGLLLATPLTVCLVVLGQYIPAFSIFARLLGDMPVLEPHFRFYQRLLADDQVEAAELVKKAVREHGVDSVINTILVPALSLADRDQAAGLLETADEARFGQALNGIFDKLLEEAGEASTETKSSSANVCLIVWPLVPLAAHAAPWLKWLFRDLGCAVVTLSPDTLSAEAAKLAQEKRPAAFVILSLAGSPVRRERQMAKRIGTLAAGVPVIIARLGSIESVPGDADEATVPAGTPAAPRTLAELCAATRPLIQQALLTN